MYNNQIIIKNIDQLVCTYVYIHVYSLLITPYRYVLVLSVSISVHSSPALDNIDNIENMPLLVDQFFELKFKGISLRRIVHLFNKILNEHPM